MQPPPVHPILDLISIHVSKCAGSSFATALRTAYPADAVRMMSGDNPANPTSMTSIDPEGARTEAMAFLANLPAHVRVLHGHVHPARFAFVDRSVPRVTILRHPVERAISHYLFFRQPPTNPIANPIRSYMLERNLTLPEFCRLPRIRRFYGETFFGGVVRSDLDLVGCVEDMDTTLRQLAALIGRPLEMPVQNVGWLRAGSPPVDDGTRRQLEGILADDIAFYREWTGTGSGNR